MEYNGTPQAYGGSRKCNLHTQGEPYPIPRLFRMEVYVRASALLSLIEIMNSFFSSFSFFQSFFFT